MPPFCACCGATATAESVARRSNDGAELLVGYCATCITHAGRDGTQALAVALSSALLGLTVSAAWPLLGIGASLAVHVGAAFVAALVPILLSPLLRRRPPSGHSAWGRAVAWSGQHLICTSRDFALAAVEQNPGARLLGTSRRPWFSPWMTAGPVLGVIASLFLHGLYYPSLRVLNLSGERFELWLDGRSAGLVEPSSVESPAAGRELAVSAGPHRLEARTGSGKVLATADVGLESGRAHLYAPLSADYCFWVERRSYGRTGLSVERSPLSSEDFFWVLPQGLDSWFAAPPDPRTEEQALSGGVVTILRQARCSQAPISGRD